MHTRRRILRAAAEGEEILLPKFVRNYSAGLDWAGNSGNLIATLLFKSDALGETFTIYSGHGLTWGGVTEAYEKIIDLKVRWCEENEYLDRYSLLENNASKWPYLYDRRYNRDIDCSKVPKVTGLKKEDFTSSVFFLRQRAEAEAKRQNRKTGLPAWTDPSLSRYH